VTDSTSRDRSSAAHIVRRAVARVARSAQRSAAQLPPEARDHLAASVRRFAKVRTSRQAVAAVTKEVESLLSVVTPIFVANPMPVSVASGRLAVVGTAAAAALLEEIDVVALIPSGGSALAGAPALLAADLAALFVEAYVAVSVRTRRLRDAGADVEPAAVARELATAMVAGTTTGTSTDIARRIARRVVKRWAAGAVPGVGAAYSAWDAQKTVVTMARLPIPPGWVSRRGGGR